MNHQLKRTIGFYGATMMGLGSILGTGVFISIGVAAGVTGPSVILAIILAGILAVCNGMSTAQLAADYPVSGGTYAYGRRYLNDQLGFVAGWLFLAAKSASAATAALAFGGYFELMTGVTALNAFEVGAIALAAITLISILGIKRSNQLNTAIVTITLLALGAFVVSSLSFFEIENFSHMFQAGLGSARANPAARFLEATALMFVAYTGYGRVATLGEEITNPKKNIPKAIMITLGITLILYISVSLCAIGSVGATTYSSYAFDNAAPLQAISNQLNAPAIGVFVGLGAMVAMLGVLLNLILGLSRVLFAMGQNNEMPSFVGKLSPQSNPNLAILVVAGIILGLMCLGDVKATWSFSAFTVLLYYSMTNICALRLPPEKRLYPKALAWVGLVGCLGLSIWVDLQAISLALVILVVGYLLRTLSLKARNY